MDSDAGDLLALARRLGDDGPAVEGRLGVRFEPPFPGATAGVEGAGGGRRLVLACTAHGPDDEPLHVLFTTLIPGRRPMVSAAPLGARVPENWRPIADLAPPL